MEAFCEQGSRGRRSWHTTAGLFFFLWFTGFRTARTRILGTPYVEDCFSQRSSKRCRAPARPLRRLGAPLPRFYPVEGRSPGGGSRGWERKEEGSARRGFLRGGGLQQAMIPFGPQARRPTSHHIYAPPLSSTAVMFCSPEEGRCILLGVNL